MAQYPASVQDQVLHHTGTIQLLERKEPDSAEFLKWKGEWDIKKEMLWMKDMGYSWDDIESALNLTSTRRSNYDKLQKFVNVVEAVGKAAADVQNNQEVHGLATITHENNDLNDLLPQGNYNLVWERMAISHGKGWSAEKMRYAWNHGVSRRFPHITINSTT